jgi:hypothetical protein
LPVSPALSDAQQEQVAAAIAEFYAGRTSQASLA